MDKSYAFTYSSITDLFIVFIPHLRRSPEGDESESPALSRVRISHHHTVDDLAVLLEVRFQRLLGRFVVEAADKQLPELLGLALLRHSGAIDEVFRRLVINLEKRFLLFGNPVASRQTGKWRCRFQFVLPLVDFKKYASQRRLQRHFILRNSNYFVFKIDRIF